MTIKDRTNYRYLEAPLHRLFINLPARNVHRMVRYRMVDTVLQDRWMPS